MKPKWIIFTLRISLIAICVSIALLLITNKITLAKELIELKGHIIVALMSVAISFLIWGSISDLDRHFHEKEEKKKLAERNLQLEILIRSTIVPTLKREVAILKSQLKSALEQELSSIRRLSTKEAFSLAKECLKEANRIYSIGFVKEVSMKEKQDYLTATINRIAEEDSTINYKRIMSHNISDRFIDHLKDVLNAVEDFKSAFPRDADDKNAEIIIGPNYCLPYSALIIDNSFLMLSLNYPDQNKKNDSYIVSRDSDFIESFCSHFEEIWNALSRELKNASIKSALQLESLRAKIQEVSEQNLQISNAIYHYPMNGKNFSLNYAMESLKEIAGLFEKINCHSYEIRNTNKNNPLSLYSSFFAQMTPNDKFFTITSPAFWAKVLRDRHKYGNDFVDASSKLLRKNVKVVRVLILDYYIPPREFHKDMSIATLDKNKNEIEQWMYWINAKAIIKHHIELQLKNPKACYEFKILFQRPSYDMSGDDPGHFGLLVTAHGKTLLQVETEGSEEIHISKIASLTPKMILHQEIIEKAGQKFDDTISFHTNETIITKRQLEFIYLLKKDFPRYFDNPANMEMLLGKNWVTPVEDPIQGNITGHYSNDFS